METAKNFKTVVKHPVLGEFEVQTRIDENNILHIMHANTTGWEQNKTTDLDLHFLIEHDVKGFQKLSDDADFIEESHPDYQAGNKSRHHINIDTMKIHYIEISGLFVRVHYIFDQFNDDSCWRMCAGHYTELYIDQRNIKPVAYSCYSNDCTVYW